MKTMTMNFKQAYEYLRENTFLYKGKTITFRTICTMRETGKFNTLRKAECGKCVLIDKKELDDMIKESRAKYGQ